MVYWPLQRRNHALHHAVAMGTVAKELLAKHPALASGFDRAFADVTTTAAAPQPPAGNGHCDTTAPAAASASGVTSGAAVGGVAVANGHSAVTKTGVKPLGAAGKVATGFSWRALALLPPPKPFTRARRAAAPETTAAAGAAECDEACKARIAERRQLFEQSRTTNDRQKILDLSRQRAALYNTTFQGASCISGLPCL